MFALLRQGNHQLNLKQAELLEAMNQRASLEAKLHGFLNVNLKRQRGRATRTLQRG